MEIVHAWKRLVSLHNYNSHEQAIPCMQKQSWGMIYTLMHNGIGKLQNLSQFLKMSLL